MPPEVFLGRTIAEVLQPLAAEVSMKALRTALEQGSSSGAQIELPLTRGNTWFELSVSRKMVEPGEKPRFVVLSRDITERKEAEARVARLAYVDSLTGLPNRRAFLERVDREIHSAQHRKEALAVLFMDLDGFKGVNDTLGHARGDLILQAAAERLRDTLRPGDLLSRPMTLGSSFNANVEFARMGGDEFTALIVDVENPDDAMAVARRIGMLMRVPFEIEGHDIMLTASIGFALYPGDGEDGATLLRHADTAMYLAKGAGRDQARRFAAPAAD